jgi:rare lipoprotein A
MGVQNKWFCTVLMSIIFCCVCPVLAQQPVITVPADTTVKRYIKTGIASYYGGSFHGRKTASGEVYNKFKLTAAHRTLPFGTLVKVTNLRTGQWVVVRINDRGPYTKKRIIDVSFRAARYLGINTGKGIAKVKVEEMPPLIPPADANDAIIVPDSN